MEDTPAMREVNALIKDSRGMTAHEAELELGWGYRSGVSLVFAMAEAIRRAGVNKSIDELTSADVRDAMETLSGFTSEGWSGPLTFSPDNHLGYEGGWVVKINKDGWIDYVSDYMIAPPLSDAERDINIYKTRP